MVKLYPPLEDLEDELFSPSDRLIERWAKNDPSLRASVIAALEADTVARERRESFLSANATEGDSVVTEAVAGIPEEIAVSPILAEMIERRVSTQKRFSNELAPAPGQIRLVDRAIGPDGADLGWDMNHPLAVLLLRGTEDDDVWYGWMVGGEPDYAGYWDVLLEEEDEPYDPLVAMVQLWNPVHIYAKSVGSVLGQLSTARLDALESAYGDFLTGERPDAAYARPGTLVDRLTRSGVSVLTGTPMGTDNDPRGRYQDLYFAAAGMVKDMARLAVEALAAERDEEPESWADVAASLAQAVRARLLENLRDFAERLGRVVQPVTFVAAQGRDEGGTQDKGLDWERVPGLFEEAVIPSEDGTSVRLLLRRIDDANLKVRLKLNGRLLQEHRLDDESPNAEIHFEPEPGLLLEVEDASGMKGTWALSK